MAQRMANYEQQYKTIVSVPPRPLRLSKWNDLSAGLRSEHQNISRLRPRIPDTNLRQLRRPSSIASVPQRRPSIDMAAVKVASREPAEPS